MASVSSQEKHLVIIIQALKLRFAEYRLARKGQDISVHVNAMEIAGSLVEYALIEKRRIEANERIWFQAGYYVSYIFDGSEWSDLSDLYSQLCDAMEARNYQI